MYYPIGWPKKLNFQYKDISVVTADDRPAEQPSDRPPHSNSVSDQHVDGNSVRVNNVNGHANNETNGQESGSESSHADDSSNEKRLLQIAANSDRTLFAVLTPRSLHVWFARVCDLSCV
jgi:hypothetical protein